MERVEMETCPICLRENPVTYDAEGYEIVVVYCPCRSKTHQWTDEERQQYLARFYASKEK